MDEFLRNLIIKEWKLGKLKFTFLDALLAVCITGTGLMIRLAMTKYEYTVTDSRKLGAMLIDFILAFFCADIVYEYTRHRNKAFLTYSIFLIYPTMIANSALCGENSVYYVFFFFVGLYYFVHNFERKGKWLGLLGIAAGAAGAAVRFRLSSESLNLGWPNFYEIIGKETFVDLFNQVSLLCLLGILFTIAYTFAKQGIEITKDLALRLFLFLALLIPYLAPSMPAWAGMTADIAALLYCMRWPKKFYVPMLHLIVSYSAYALELNKVTKLPMVLYSVILLFLLADTGAGIYEEITDEASE